MPSDRTLSLGTIFTGKVDKSFRDSANQLRQMLAELNKSMGAVNSATAKQKEIMRTGGSELSDYSKKMGASVGETRKYQKALSELTATHGRSGTAMKTAVSQLDAVEKAVQKTANRMTQAGKNGRAFAESANRVALTNSVLAGKLKTTATGFQKVEQRAKQAATATKKVGDNMGWAGKRIGHLSNMLDRLRIAFRVTMTYGLAGSIMFSVMRAFREGLTAIVDFDQGLKNLQAITGATNAELLAMGETVKQVAEVTKFSAAEIIEGMVLLGQAGFSAAESMDSIQAAADLATGTLTEMNTTTDLLTTTIRAFNLNTAESTRVADVMATAINSSKLTIEKLSTAFNYIGAAGSQAGLSLEEVAATLMVLANNGLKASTMATGFRQVLARMIAPNRVLREEFEKQGIALESLNPKTQGYMNALRQMVSILIDSETKTVNMAKAFQLFGLRGSQVAAIITKTFVAGELGVALTETFENIGAAAIMAAKQAEGLGIKFKNLADRAKLIALALGEAGVGGTLRAFVDTLRAVTKGIADFVNGIGRLPTQLGLLTLALGGASYGLTALYKLMILPIVGKFVGTITLLTRKIHLLSLFTGRLTATFAVLWATLATHPFLAVALTISAVILAFRHWDTANRRAIKTLETQSIEMDKGIRILQSYKGALESLRQEQERGRDVTLQYKGMMGRLIADYPELESKIGLTTEAFENNIEAIGQLIALKLEDNVITLTELIKRQGIEVDRTKIKYGLWKESIDSLRISFGWLGDKLRAGIELIGKYNKILGVFIFGVGKALGIDRLKEVGKRIAEVGKEIEGATDKVITHYKEAGESSEKAKKIITEQANAINRLAMSFVDSVLLEKKSIDEIADVLEATGNLTENQIDKILAKLIDLVIATRKSISVPIAEIEERMRELPEAFKSVYKELDALRKVDFVRAVETMDKRTAAFDKQARILKLSEADLAAGRLAIQENMLAEFQKKQVKRVIKEQNIYSELLNQAKLHAEQKLFVLEKRAKEEEMTETELAERKAQIELDLAKTILDIRNQVLRESIDLYATDAKAYLDAQNSKVKATLDYDKALEKHAETVKELDKTEKGFVETSLDVAKSQEEVQEAVTDTSLTFDKTGISVDSLSSKLRKMGESFSVVADAAQAAAEGIAAHYTARIKDLFEGMAYATGGASMQMRNQIRDLDNEMRNSVNTINNYIRMSTGKGFIGGESGFGGIPAETETFMEQWIFDLRRLPTEFKNLYNTLDGLRKVDFANVVKSMETELVAFEEYAKELQISEQELADGRKEIRDKVLAEFTNSMDDNFATWRETLDKLPYVYREMYKEIDAFRKIDFVKATETMEAELALVEEHAKELRISEQELRDARKKIREETFSEFIEEDLDTYLTLWTDKLKELPREFKILYSQVAVLRKADFIDVVRTMEKELIEFAEFAHRLQLSERELAQGRIDIRRKTVEELRKIAEQESRIGQGQSISGAGGIAPRPLVRFKKGGVLPGYGGGDRVPILAESGEFVIRKEAVKKYGLDFIQQLNGMALRFAKGGLVGIQKLIPDTIKAPTIFADAPQFATGGVVSGQQGDMHNTFYISGGDKSTSEIANEVVRKIDRNLTYRQKYNRTAFSHG